MTVLNFPASPTVGDTYTENNVIYTWNGTFWAANNAQDLDARFVNVTGDTMTGNLTVPSINGSPFPGPAFSAYNASNQTLANGAFTKLIFPTEEFDTASCFDSTTNYRFTANVAGYYQFTACMNLNASSGVTLISFYKNGSEFKRASQIPFVGSSTVQPASTVLIHLNGSTDYVEVYGYHTAGGSLDTAAGQPFVYFQGFLARPE